MRVKNIQIYGAVVLFLFAWIAQMLFVLPSVKAQTQPREFALQVYPSPIVETIKPGQSKTIELRIRNNGSQTENLQIKTRNFNYDNNSGQVKLDNSEASQVKDWVVFENPTFTIAPGQWFNEKITINTPKNAGFSYSFVLLINRKNDINPAPGTPAIHGSVAVFTLLNVDRPDAKRQLELVNFVSVKRMYEYLPATFKVTIKNTGNTIIQPYGNIFIQRSKNAKSPITLLPVNETKGYILPGTTRTMTSEWSEGFPVYQTVNTAANTQPKKKLLWNWDNIKNLRFGRYHAVLIGAYNDGQRDVPIQTELTFWVIPWKLIIITIVLLTVLVIGFYTIFKKGYQILPKRKKHVVYNTDKP